MTQKLSSLEKRILYLLVFVASIISTCKKKDIQPPKSSVKKILSFTFYKSDNQVLAQDNVAVISHDSILISLPASTNVSNLIPTISYSGFGVSPASKTAQNFTNPVLYTVTAEDGSTATYKTIIRFLSGAKEITSFIFKKANNPDLPGDIAGVISGDSISAIISPGIDITALKPSVTFTGVSVTPGNEEAHDFTYPAGYGVVAEDGSARTYAVFVNGNSDVFISGDDRYLYAINAATGAFRWKYYVGSTGVPTYDNGIVFVAGYDNSIGTVIYAINAIDGSLKWTSSNLTVVNSSLTIPVVKYGKIYFGGNGFINYTSNPGDGAYFAGFILALDEQTGLQQWVNSYITSNTPTSLYNTNVTVEDNMACIYDELYGFHSFNATDGTSLWNGAFGELGRTNPAIANNTIVCGIEGGIAASDEQGNLLWRIINLRGNFSSPTISNAIVYSAEDNLYAIYQNGTVKWQTPLANAIFYGPFFYNDNLYISNSKGDLSCYNASDGSMNWTKQSYGAYPVVLNNNIYICDNYHRFNCLDASTGNVKWIYSGGSNFSGPCCVVDSKNIVHHTTESGEQN